MSEFDKLKNEGEDYARRHPEQVKKGEDAVEDKLRISEQDEDQQDEDQQAGDQQRG
jgi:hypothetical protein